jgi:hypothetical protein
MDERIAAFRKEAEIIEKRFGKWFTSRPGFSPENPDSIHNYYTLYESKPSIFLVFPTGSPLTPVPKQQLEEAFHKIFG